MSDLIYRQAAIDAIMASTSKYTGFMEMEMYTADDAVEAIKVVPTASPWHRVEEELPTEKGPYITAYYDGYVGENEWHFIGIGETAVGWLYDADAVRYWMPMPTPPKEDA